VKIWIDADSCPRPIKQIVFRASKRLKIQVCLVANRDIPVPASSLVTTVRVSEDFEMADAYIVGNVDPDDLVITTDIPLPAKIIDKGAAAINPRVDLYTKDTIQERLSYRNFMHQLRAEGLMEDTSSRQRAPGRAMAGRRVLPLLWMDC